MGVLTVPVPVRMLHTPTPVVNVTAVTVVFGTAPQMVWVNGLITGVLFSGSTTTPTVRVLLGQVLPAAVCTTYWIELVPTPKPISVVIGTPASTEPVPVGMLHTAVPVVGEVTLKVVFGVAPQMVWVSGLTTGLLFSGSTLTVTTRVLLGQVLPAAVCTTYWIELVPTPKPISVVVGTPASTEPVAVGILHTAVPVVGEVTLKVVVGEAPQMVCVNGLTTGLAFSGSTLTVAVNVLLGQVLPAAVCTTYWIVFIPTPRPFNDVVGTPAITEPVPVGILHTAVPVVGEVTLKVVFGTAPQMVCVNGLTTGLAFSGSTLTVAVNVLLGQVLPAAVCTTYWIVLEPTPNPINVVVGTPASTEPVPVGMLHTAVPVVGEVTLKVVFGVAPQMVWVNGLTKGLSFSGSTLTVAVNVLLGQVLPAAVCTTYWIVLIPTPRPFNDVVGTPAITEPVPVGMLHTAVPVVGEVTLKVVFGTAPQMVWVNGLTTGLAFSGSTLTVAVNVLLGQVLPAAVCTTYWIVLEPTPKPISVVVGTPASTEPVPVGMLHTAVPVVGEVTLKVVFGVAPHMVWVSGLTTGLLFSAYPTMVIVAELEAQTVPLAIVHFKIVVPVEIPVKLLFPALALARVAVP